MSANLAYLPTLLDAVAHQNAGRVAEAESGFACVLAVEPDQPQALLFAGMLALKGGQPERAVALLHRAAAVRPGDAESRFAYGNALWIAGRKPEAIIAWEETSGLRAGHAGALLNLGRAYEEMGDTEAAIASCERAVAAVPGHGIPHAALASALRAAGRTLEALEAAERSIDLAPDLPQAHFQLGAALKALGQPEQAARCLAEAVRLGPGDAPSLLNLGNVLFDLKDPVAAERYCRAAIAADPSMAEAHAALGFMLTERGALHEAVAACSEGVRLRPDLAEAQSNLGIALLSAGDLKAGFARYEWRKRHPARAGEFLELPGPEWRGGSLAGKRLLVVAEQGLGDAIMFARYASVLADAGAAVVLACDRRLLPLLAQAPGVAEAVPKQKTYGPYDLWVDQMSLPHLLGTTLETIPSPGGYLHADPVLAEAWRRRLGPNPAGTLRVGMVWAGNPLHTNDAARSSSVQAFEPLVGLPGCEMFSLQVGPRAAEASVLGFTDLSPLLTSYAETAALVDNLDLVVTVDTSVAHLAAALGKPTWVMLPHNADWRWLRARRDSPWYDSVLLFRQERAGDWGPVVLQVADALRALPLPAFQPSSRPASRSESLAAAV